MFSWQGDPVECEYPIEKKLESEVIGSATWLGISDKIGNCQPHRQSGLPYATVEYER